MKKSKDDKLNSWIDLIQGVPQGSIFAKLLFNVYLNDLIFFHKVANIWNFGDKTKLFILLENVSKCIEVT